MELTVFHLFLIEMFWMFSNYNIIIIKKNFYASIFKHLLKGSKLILKMLVEKVEWAAFNLIILHHIRFSIIYNIFHVEIIYWKALLHSSTLYGTYSLSGFPNLKVTKNEVYDVDVGQWWFLKQKFSKLVYNRSRICVVVAFKILKFPYAIRKFKMETME